jgi:Mor family transcriptional regulator
MSIKEKISELFQEDLINALADELSDCEQAQAIADQVIATIKSKWAGNTIYIPANKKTDEKAAIKAAFNGTNHYKICKQFGISRSKLYRIINQ